MTLYEKIKHGRIIKRRYTIVEIKYCTDTRPEPQQTHADLQHTGLISSLTKSRYNTEARLITIVLGMAGYIYIPGRN
jgi:phosphoribosyl 1,2-cyclic phosphodiesterase